MSSIPIGAWFGIAIVLLASWAQDIRGVVVGVVLIAVTAIATKRRQGHADPEVEQYDGGR